MAGYSNRSASVGFTAEARRAGMSAAPSAAEHRIKVAAAIVAGSVGLTSYSCDSTRRPSAQTHGSAMAIPAAIITSASRSTSQTVAEPRGPERQSYADLARALRHHERHHAVQADEREQQRQRAEAAGKRRPACARCSMTG